MNTITRLHDYTITRLGKVLLFLCLFMSAMLFNPSVNIAQTTDPHGPQGACYMIYSTCHSDGAPNYFNPGAITFKYTVKTQSTSGTIGGAGTINTYTTYAVAEQYGELGWQVCFSGELYAGVITEAYICTDTTTTTYVVSNVVGDKIYLDKIVPKIAKIDGITYDTWHTPIGYSHCQSLWEVSYNEGTSSIPTWHTCKQEINVAFNHGLDLNWSDGSGIRLQIAIHKYPLSQNDNPLAYKHIKDYTKGNSIDVRDLMDNLPYGERYIMSFLTVCTEGYRNVVPYVNLYTNKLRTFIFDFDEEKHFTGYLKEAPPLESQQDYWDNTFPGLEFQGNPFLNTSITRGGIDENAYYKYQIIKLTTTGADDTILYDSGNILGKYFFGPLNPNNHTSVFLDYMTSGYFSTSVNENFVIRVTSTHPCTGIRNLFFRTNDNPSGLAENDNQVIWRENHELLNVTVYGNPSNMFRFSLSGTVDIKGDVFLNIYDSNGARVFNELVSNGRTSIYESSYWGQGIYYYEVKSSHGIVRGKWIKH